jgi:hypothetical protein
MQNHQFQSLHEYFLNFNYGKVISGPRNFGVPVAIYDFQGAMAHRTCVGELTLEEATQLVEEKDAYVSYFFGSAGYRTNENESWHFLCTSHYLMACVLDKQVWIVINDNKPFVFTPNCPHFDLIESIVIKQTVPAKSNVVSIFSGK